MRTDIYKFIWDCIDNPTMCGSWDTVVCERRHGTYQYKFQRISDTYDRMRTKDKEIFLVPSSYARKNLTRLRRQCQAAYEQGIIHAYTVMHGRISITWNKPYIPKERSVR